MRVAPTAETQAPLPTFSICEPSERGSTPGPNLGPHSASQRSLCCALKLMGEARERGALISSGLVSWSDLAADLMALEGRSPTRHRGRTVARLGNALSGDEPGTCAQLDGWLKLCSALYPYQGLLWPQRLNSLWGGPSWQQVCTYVCGACVLCSCVTDSSSSC